MRVILTCATVLMMLAPIAATAQGTNEGDAQELTVSVKNDTSKPLQVEWFGRDAVVKPLTSMGEIVQPVCGANGSAFLNVHSTAAESSTYWSCAFSKCLGKLDATKEWVTPASSHVRCRVLSDLNNQPIPKPQSMEDPFDLDVAEEGSKVEITVRDK